MNIKHKKCLYFVNGGLFAQLTKFEDLEVRIAALPQEERGDAFEVFAQGYLATQRIVQAAQVWSFDGVPQHVRAALGLGARDMGIDGIILTNQDIYQAYQVKYRSGRESLTWQEVSTFMGLSDRVATRILFTNSNELSSVLDDRTGFYAITGTDLDRLNEQDFYAIEQWLKDSPVIVCKASQRPHQKEALEAIGFSLRGQDRVTAVMACGTGKTLLALWLAEQQAAQSVLVLLPSLSLVRQTLHEWVKETKWQNFSFLCICSDKTVVTNDEIVVKQIDCDFPVTTDAVEVQKFLACSKDRKIVFSTYQSSMLIPQNFIFDIGIFDEAHKTAGREGTRFAHALNNENVAIKKRVFLTATPRHYDIAKKDKEGEARLVFSMDDQNVYGQIGYSLSFAEAAKRDIICNYKIIISVVTSDSLDRELLKHGEVVVQGDTVKAHRLANIFALTHAIERYKIKRIFTFHNSVKNAQSFTSDASEFIKDFNVLHVNGEMPTSIRERIMHDFKNSPKAIMSNARCLTEGVDVPAVDMVAFISPKKSKVDIVQAAGRAMRKAEGKDCGYILVPIFLEISQGESIKEALEKTQYDDIWQVLQALQEHDESLVEIIAQMRQEIGRIGSCNDSLFREKIEILAPEIGLVRLREAITTHIIDKLGLTWDERFGELLKFKEEYGHCNVPQKYRDRSLAMWVGTQRNLYNSRNKRLTVARINKLNEIGFDWDPIATQWKKIFLELCRYKENNGHCDIPQRSTENPQLGTWTAEQRKNFKKNKLGLDNIKQLESIGFVFDVLDARWEKMYLDLCQWHVKTEHGHTKVARDYSKNTQLGEWISQQRKAYRHNNISADRIEKLEKIGFSWTPLESYQEQMLEELRKFKEKNGHCNVPQQYKLSTLGKWVIAQRIRQKKGKLSAEMINKLNAIGFDWSPLDSIWESMFKALCEFKNKYGHCIIPQNYFEIPKLGNWVSVQRNLYFDNRLSIERIEKLKNIGFVWNRFDSKWDEMYHELSEFKIKMGHCNLAPDNENYSLFRWVGTQRYLYSKKQLSLERIDKLNQLCFCWYDSIELLWEVKFSELCEYKKNNGNSNVPLRYRENRSLGAWVIKQRQNYKNKELAQKYIERLNGIDFDWDILATAWKSMFSVLSAYKEKLGDCNKVHPSVKTIFSKVKI